MSLIHFMVFMFFVAILLYLGLKNGSASTSILTAGFNGVNTTAKTLQGR